MEGLSESQNYVNTNIKGQSMMRKNILRLNNNYLLKTNLKKTQVEKQVRNNKVSCQKRKYKWSTNMKKELAVLGFRICMLK